MKLVVALLGPALIAMAIMESATFVADRTAERPAPQRLEWGGRVFTSEDEFARWLAARGRSYTAWRERHPDSPWSRSADPRPLRLWSATAAAGVGAAASGLLVLVLARRTGGVSGFRVARRLVATASSRLSGALTWLAPRLRHGGRAVASAVAAGAVLLMHGVRAGARASRPLGRAVRRGLGAVRANAPVHARRGRALVRESTADLATWSLRARDARIARSALVYGSIVLANGLVGVGLAFLLQ